MQSVLNIAMVGHVDHGKTTLTKALTGKWTDTHSEEMKRGITIKLGYADFEVRYCEECKRYTTKEKCEICGNKTKFIRKISIVDCPGHEMLMATVLSTTPIIHGFIFVIAADEKCPQPQTLEHFKVIQLTGIKNVVIAQTKIDVVSKERAKEHYNEIKEFLKGSVIEDAPIIPVVAHHGINIDKLLEAIENYIPTPKFDESKPLRMFITRSFDINKPGAKVDDLQGGVVGGSIVQGVLKKGQKVKLLPGIEWEGKLIPVSFEADDIREENEKLETAKPGGLIAVQTYLDPYFTKGDKLVRAVIVAEDEEDYKIVRVITVSYKIIEREGFESLSFAPQEPLIVIIGSSATIGFVSEIKGEKIKILLKKHVAIFPDSKAIIMKRVKQKWRLFAIGEILYS